MVKIISDCSDIRLDKFLSDKTGLSRNRILSLIKNECLTPSLKADTKVKSGQVFELTIPPAMEDETPKAQNIELNILYEDDDIIVINKPPFLVVHPACGNWDNTLVNALLYHCGNSLSGIGGIKRPGIVHRIDKETSGILVIAKNDFAHQHLSRQFSDHSIKRIYTAIVYGLCPTQGTITGNIGRDPRNRQRQAIVLTGGKEATTHYRLIKPLFDGLCSLIECELETGRTHQIRVHMTSLKHPLVGDKIYGTSPKGTPKEIKNFHRQALHAGVLGFIHPRTGKYIEFFAPLPEDMQNLLEFSNL